MKFPGIINIPLPASRLRYPIVQNYYCITRSSLSSGNLVSAELDIASLPDHTPDPGMFVCGGLIRSGGLSGVYCSWFFAQ